MKKITFLVDGFNVYHSTLSLKRITGYSTKWLDLYSLCKSYVHLFGKEASLESVYYFSAIPYYLSPTNPQKIKRHEDYIKCLQSTGVLVELGRFKQKEVFCDKCRSMIIKHEEKETDVAIAVKLLEIFFTDSSDIIVIVSGDTDLSPVIRKCQSLYNEKKIVCAFPFGRKNKELAALAPDSFSINKKQYIKHQLTNPCILATGEKIYKPSSW